MNVHRVDNKALYTMGMERLLTFLLPVSILKNELTKAATFYNRRIQNNSNTFLVEEKI